MWLDAYHALKDGRGEFGRKEWDQLLGHCMAVTDEPCASFAAELVEAYPDAKVILTVRDSSEAWAKSIERTIYSWGYRWYADRGPFVACYRWLRGTDNAIYKMIRRSWYQSRFNEFPQKRGKLYEEHNEYIKSIVPPERLLVYNVKEGWEPLCAFLGKEVPPTPFPRINDTDEYIKTAERGNKMLRKRALINGISLVAKIGFVAAAAYVFAARMKLLSGRGIRLLSL